MSKKKIKTKEAKTVVHHHLKHLERATSAITVKGKHTSSDSDVKRSGLPISPLDSFVRRDLKGSLVLIFIFVLIIGIIGIITYKTGFLNPLLSHWGIKY